jgi:hypothetical protein
MQYELFGYAGLHLPGVARVTGGYAITSADGRRVAGAAPTAIATDGARVVRRIAVPLDRLEPGRYHVRLEVNDLLAGHTLTAGDSFSVEAGEGDRPVAAPVGDVVPADDPRVAVMGRVDRSRPGRLRIGYPGVTLRIAFEGTSLGLRASGDTPDNYLGVTVDGGESRVVRLAKGDSEVVLAAGLPAGAHTVEVVRRTETWQGITTVRGFVLGAGARLLDPGPWPARRMVFIGDSVTCGEDVDRAPGCTKDASSWNAALSYGMRLARALQAQAHLVCYGGRGLVRDWQGRSDVLNAPQFFDLAVPDAKDAPSWDHASYVPDARVHGAEVPRYPGDACDAHPTGEQHAAMARDLEPIVRRVTGW